ncbi:DNA/RNA polymerase [Setomelanomma holmii]|uniref:DNA-directed RNA polymerase n=1 Tax=Setomelanomma holmii TaxID=210430 RepID=A0A9P4GX48_9PLEO|nr:DNA/RNA polymerase [Setomelanomma holmii]
MFVRAARRKLRNDALRSHVQTPPQLTLPWLCPAQLRRTGNLSAISSHVHDSKRPRRTSLSPRHETRSLATTAELQPTPSPSPFHGFMHAWSSQTQSPDLARLSPWNSSNPLILSESPTPARRIQGHRKAFGIAGDAVELHQNLYACLRVGRLDRASIILSRLADLFEPTAPELVDAHNIYLQTMFDLAQQDSKPDSMATIEDWYNTTMVRRSIEPNAQTFVTLLRAAMNFLDDGEQDDAIRRFMALAHEYGEDMVDDINYSAEFSDEEWNMLINAQPDEFEEPPQVSELQDMVVNTPAARKSLIEHGLRSAFVETIKPVNQKGLGLDSLKQALAIFDDSQRVEYPHDMEGTQVEKDQAYAYTRQLRMEQDALEAAVSRWKQEDEKLQSMGIHGVMSSKNVQALMYNWYTALLPLFKKNIERCKQVLAAPSEENSRDPAHSYGAWLEQCKAERLAALTVARVVAACVKADSSDNGPFKISSLTSKIGTDIEDYLAADAAARRDAFLKKQRKQTRRDLVTRLHKTKTSAPATTAPAAGLWNTEKTQIPFAVRVQMGALALELLLQSATITVTANNLRTGKEVSSTQSAFQHNIGFQQGKKIGFVIPHHELLSKLRNESVHHVQPLNLPMVVEPKPWSSYSEGGYYTTPQRVVRQKNSDTAQRAYAQSAIENGDMTQVLAALDSLGRVPWQINASVLNVMAQAWNRGEAIGALVPDETSVPRPEEPAADASPQERARWGKRLQAYENLKSGLHSQRCFQNFQLETARAFVNEKKIFFPHNVDFRGRAYPLPPILNHIGADIARGLLKFAQGKELGTVGLQWLKIHLANLYGFDKASLKDREQFAMDNLSEIYDSATNPLDGRRWWSKAEDPWQCLACCIELKNAFDSSDPTRYISQLPVHQDGTCNGLQHYAALGGDHAGARQVNLEPSDRPQDIYTGVAELVKEMVAKDAKEGQPLASFIDGHITRKVVKRTVMTNVYGVTFIGAKTQVEGELRDMFPNFIETDKVRSLGAVALYVAYKIFEALGKIFNGAQEIQYWLGECGDRITTSLSAEQIRRIYERYEGKDVAYDAKYKSAKKLLKTEKAKLNKDLEAFKTSIIWTTPLKMPIVQPYRKDTVEKVATKLQKITVAKRSAHNVVDKRKQLQAFPPNFIHSLDATHMTLSALKCSEMGLDFAAVHDSFWTHACDIPNLNVILRDAFVRMHSEDIVQRLAEEFKARYAGALYCANIMSQSDVGAQIRKWRVDFYKSTGRSITSNKSAPHGHASFEEVALEGKRQALLNSEDPEKVKQGQEMVTPTSIWIENQDPKALSSFRMNLLGETQDKKTSKYSEMRDKVLDREAEMVAETNETDAIPETATASDSLKEISDPKEPTKSLRDDGRIQVWIPLTFPPVPKKGGWDVSRLRESQYFFS